MKTMYPTDNPFKLYITVLRFKVLSFGKKAAVLILGPSYIYIILFYIFAAINFCYIQYSKLHNGVFVLY